MIALKGDKKNPTNGRWTKTEHDRFMKGLEKFGKDWVSVQKVVKTRTLTQVRSHAQKVFLKMDQSDVEALVGKENQFQYSIKLNQPKVSDEAELEYKGQVSESPETRQQKKETNLVDLFMLAIEEHSKEPSAQHETVIYGQQNQPKGQQNQQPSITRKSSEGNQPYTTEKLEQSPSTNMDKSNILMGKNIYLGQIYPIYIDLSQQDHGL